MERLLEDATALSGVEYDIDNLGDVYSAIHVIQEDLGIAGVAAEEASTTFSGSFAAMKAAATNLLANLTLGEDIGPSLEALQTTVSNFLLGNLFPMIGNILEQIPTLLSGLTDIIVETLSQITDNADAIAQIGVDVISGLIVGIAQAVPLLLEAALSIVTALGEALIATDWSTVGTNVLNGLKSAIDTLSGSILGVDTSVISSLANGIMQAAPNLITTAGSVLNSLLSGILSYATQLLSAGAELVNNLSDGFGGNVADIIGAATDVITSLLDTILDSLPELLSAGVKLLGELAIGFIQNLPEIVGAVLDMISSIIETIVSHLPDLLQKGIELVGEIAAGIISAIPTIVQSAKDLCDKFKEHFSNIDWAELGKNLIDGIVDGIKNAAGSFYEAVKSVVAGGLSAGKEEADVHSPSRKWRKELGYQLGAGTTLGFEDGFDSSKIATSLSNGLKVAQSTKVASSNNDSSTSALSLEAIYEAVRQGASDATPAIYLNQREVSRTFSKLGVSLA